jgi:hypothetical protein
MAIDPDDPTTRYNVACFYAQIGELDTGSCQLIFAAERTR